MRLMRTKAYVEVEGQRMDTTCCSKRKMIPCRIRCVHGLFRCQVHGKTLGFDTDGDYQAKY